MDESPVDPAVESERYVSRTVVRAAYVASFPNHVDDIWLERRAEMGQGGPPCRPTQTHTHTRAHTHTRTRTHTHACTSARLRARSVD
jgi:hypothetical protein